MNEKRSLFIGIGLLTLLVFLIIASGRLGRLPSTAKGPEAHAQASAGAGAAAAQPGSGTYGIDQVKTRDDVSSRGDPRSLSEACERFPAADVGKDPAKGWSRVSPEDKAKLVKSMDASIEHAKETLKINPDDKKARHLLFVSETIKDLALHDFNYAMTKDGPARRSKPTDAGKTQR